MQPSGHTCYEAARTARLRSTVRWFTLDSRKQLSSKRAGRLRTRHGWRSLLSSVSELAAHGAFGWQ
uniref:Uncharacterized protein n=1 Tax=Anopheles coluzzii TaxID=1518534 RepID=A0A8W7P187_ANOCL